MINVELFTRSFQFATTVSPLGHLDFSYFVSCYTVKTLRNNLITLFQIFFPVLVLQKVNVCLYSINLGLLSLKLLIILEFFIIANTLCDHVFLISVLIECIEYYK